MNFMNNNWDSDYEHVEQYKRISPSAWRKIVVQALELRFQSCGKEFKRLNYASQTSGKEFKRLNYAPQTRDKEFKGLN